MVNTKYYDAVIENMTQVKAMSFLTVFGRAKISPIIFFCSTGPSCITVKIIKIKKSDNKSPKPLINSERSG